MGPLTKPSPGRHVDPQILAEAIAELEKRRGLGARVALQQLRARYLGVDRSVA